MRLHKIATHILGTLVMATLSGSCVDSGPLKSGICGNFVVDPGEDCDVYPLEKGTACAAPDKPNACRQTCGDTMGCPTGWGCGNDGICRHASGSFAPLGEPVPFASHGLMYSGDFDGDGATDALVLGHENAVGTRPARIVYPPSASDASHVQLLNVAFAAPAIRNAEAGSATGIAFAEPNGVGLLHGTFDRAAEFGTFPFFSVPMGAPFRILPMNVLSDVAGDELVAFMERPNEPPSIVALTEYTAETLVALPQGVNSIAGDLGRGRCDENAACEQIVYGFRGANQVFVYSPCHTEAGTSTWNAGGTPTTITLPSGITIDNGVLVADLDFDGHLDILIGTHETAHVAWGNGDGTFLSNKQPGGLLNHAGPYALPDAATSNPGFPLAVADLNADSMIDFVLPHGLLVSKAGGHVYVYENLGDMWTTAIIADFNANGAKDVICASSTAIDLTFLNNAGASVFNRATLSTNSPVSSFAAADFDGDLINDVAFVESFVDDAGEPRSSISVAFGESHGAPSNIVPVGQLEYTPQIASAIVMDSDETGNALDGIADLIAIDQHSITVNGIVEPVRHVILFRGEASRVMRTSRSLESGDRSALPVALSFATLEDETPEIVALGAEHATGQLGFWAIENVESDSVVPSPLLDAPFHPAKNAAQISFHYGAFLAAGDLNEDGVDELVAIAPYGTAPDGAAVVIGDYNKTTGLILPRPEKPISAAISIDAKFELHDIDGDGHLDGVLSTETHKEPGDLIVFWGDGKGDLLTNAPDHVQPDGGLTDFACHPAQIGCTLFLTAPSGTYSARVETGRRFVLTKITDLPAAESIATGDFDRDGVFDIVLHSSDRVTFFRSLPVLP